MRLFHAKGLSIRCQIAQLPWSMLDHPADSMVLNRSRVQGLRGGHIPGSANMYYGDVLNEDGTMKGPDAIAELLSSLSVSKDQQIVSTCGSGVTAAIILLAICQVRQDGLRMYDGSWTEWALHPESPMSN